MYGNTEPAARGSKQMLGGPYLSAISRRVSQSLETSENSRNVAQARTYLLKMGQIGPTGTDL